MFTKISIRAASTTDSYPGSIDADSTTDDNGKAKTQM